MTNRALAAGLGLLILVGCSSTPTHQSVSRHDDGSAVLAAAHPTTTAAKDAKACEFLSDKEIADYRAAGPEGLDELLEGIFHLNREGEIPRDDPDVKAAFTTIDKIARQRDAFASGLYWYTDLDAAKKEAARTHQHILSLRLLGNLDEEYSCANSRFFRTALYANADVSYYLRKNFVLHWKSVRPAPLVTIEMGDGRRIKRTITGNSIHYVLDSDGTVLDALPGLYGPKNFLAVLVRSENLDHTNADSLRKWHGAQADGICRQWLVDAVVAGLYGQAFSDRVQGGIEQEFGRCLAEAFPGQDVHVVPAFKPASRVAPRKPTEFEPRAISKGMVERPISRKTAPSVPPEEIEPPKPQPPETIPVLPPDSDKRPLVERMNNEAWKKLALLHIDEARLDKSSRRLMIAKLPYDSVTVAEHLSGSVGDQNTPFARTLRRFEDAIAQDSVHNEYFFHTQIHQWLEEDTKDVISHDVEALNKRVYAELFLTPDYDAWLGLVPEDTYTALDKDGCACDPGAPSMR